jgi:hypothetical protein
MSSPDPTRRPGSFQGPADSDPLPIRPHVMAEDELAAYLDRLDAEEAAMLRRARRQRLLVRLGIALVGLGVALLLAVAAVHLGRQPSPPTTVPAPVTVPAPGGTGYVPVPAGMP